MLIANESAAAVALAFGIAGMRDVALVSETVALGADKAERRLAVRFPIEQEVRYKVIRGNTAEVGSGRSLNISSNGILFTTERTLAPQERVEVAVNWPAQLAHKLPLKLVTTGRVVRSGDRWDAIEIYRYDFRTQGAHGMG
jgi:hydroxyethylthiazole kinase-like sugar kinase family protein